VLFPLSSEFSGDRITASGHATNVILDIRYKHKGPEQFQGVSMTTIYLEPAQEVHPELMIHFLEYSKSSIAIPLKSIKSIQVTND
jgi:hypothetical protein